MQTRIKMNSPKNLKAMLRALSLIGFLFISGSILAQDVALETGKAQDGWWSAQWTVEAAPDRSEYIRLRNRWQSTYVHIEHGTPAVGKAPNGWWSAMWSLKQIGSTSYYHIQNRYTGQYLHNQNGTLEAGSIQLDWISAQWQMVKTGEGRFVRFLNRKTQEALHIENLKKPGSDKGAAATKATTTKAKTYTFSVSNHSIWLVSYRVYTKESGWSDWKKVDLGKKATITHKGVVTNYDIQYKDITTWKDISGTPVMATDGANQHFVVSGNTFSGIKME
ncbi:MAG: RICIN domain-containing protein [Bacteroidetes bacterium]|nr:RICIN domain-containing protein [Bacteroidota bacterium]